MEKTSKGGLLWKLFYTTLTISTCTFGGGFVIVTFMQKRFVDAYHWLEKDEMLDIVAMAQSCPGSIAVNASILVGWRMAGFWGMVTAVLGTMLPPIVILSVISLFYKAFATNRYVALVLRGMQAGVAAIILDVVCKLGWDVLRKKQIIHILMMVAAFVCVFFFKVNAVLIILAAAVVGILLALLGKRRRKT